MSDQTTQPKFIPTLYCSLFGHSYHVSKKVTYHVKEYTCSHCKKQLTTSSNGNLVELTPKFREINAILERIHQSRRNRLKRNPIISSIYQTIEHQI